MSMFTWGCLSVAALWISYELVTRWLKSRADRRWFASIKESVPRDVWHPKPRGVLSDEDVSKIAGAFKAQDSTLPRARTRAKRKK